MKIVITFVLVLILASSTKAQKLKYGFSIGLALTDIRSIPNNKYKAEAINPRISFNINGYLEYKTSKLLGLSIEPGFIQKGYKFSHDEGRADDIIIKLNYIQFPIQANFYLTKKVFLSFGPEFSYKINSRVKEEDYSGDASDLYNKKFEISGLAGINLIIIKRINLGFRYNHGITNIFNMNAFGNSGIDESKEFNTYLQLLIRLTI
jgi:hypothetical protein